MPGTLKPSGNERISLFFKKFDFEKTNSIVQWGPSSITCGISLTSVLSPKLVRRRARGVKHVHEPTVFCLPFQRCFCWRCKNHLWQGVYLKTCISNLPKWSRNVRTSQLKAMVGYSWAWVSIIPGQTIATYQQPRSPQMGAGLGRYRNLLWYALVYMGVS